MSAPGFCHCHVFYIPCPASHSDSFEHIKFDKNYTFEEFKKNIEKAEVDDIVIPIVKTSEDAAKDFDKKVELIFIDGSHEVEDVKLDFELWYPKMVEGGIMAFHDSIYHSGPRKTVKKYVYKSGLFRNIQLIDSITYAEKTSNISKKEKRKNKWNLHFKRKLHIVKYYFKKYLVR